MQFFFADAVKSVVSAEERSSFCHGSDSCLKKEKKVNVAISKCFAPLSSVL